MAVHNTFTHSNGQCTFLLLCDIPDNYFYWHSVCYCDITVWPYSRGLPLYLMFDVLSVRNLRHHPLYDTTAELLTTASSLRFAANINSIYVPYSKDSKRMHKNTRAPWSTLLIWETFPSNKQARAKDHTGWLKVAIFSRTSDISSLNEQNYKLTKIKPTSWCY